MIAFNGDSLRLLMDEHLLQGELKCRDTVAGASSAATCTIRDDEVDVLQDSDALVSWLTVPSIGEALKSWTNIQYTKKHQLLKVIQQLEKEFDIIETWRRKKSELENQKEALLAIESICIKELDKRKQVEMHIPQSYASLLSKRQKELDGADNGAITITFLLATMVIIPVLIVVAARADELGLQEKELKHEIEHDVERKESSKRSYQRQIVEEDKHRNLAKQNKHAVASISEELKEMDVTCSTDLGPGLRNVGENNCFINVIVQVGVLFKKFSFFGGLEASF
ncbi:unnamed protein product [Camellia sinensis]